MRSIREAGFVPKNVREAESLCCSSHLLLRLRDQSCWRWRLLPSAPQSASVLLVQTHPTVERKIQRAPPPPSLQSFSNDRDTEELLWISLSVYFRFKPWRGGSFSPRLASSLPVSVLCCPRLLGRLAQLYLLLDGARRVVDERVDETCH